MRRIWMTAFTVAVLAIPGLAGTTTAATPKCGGKVATIVRTSGPDVINGTSGPDVIVARGGDDQIDGRGGNDTICAGGGDDEVKGGGGRDRVFGNGGDDHLAGGRGDDTINGGAGSDRCAQNAGSGAIKACETADLSVHIDMVDQAEHQIPINVEIVVTNHGPHRASYSVQIANDNNDATCEGGFDGGIYPQAALDPGEHRAMSSQMTCTVEGPTDPWATIDATVIANARDLNGGNDSDSDKVFLIPGG